MISEIYDNYVLGTTFWTRCAEDRVCSFNHRRGLLSLCSFDVECFAKGDGFWDERHSRRIAALNQWRLYPKRRERESQSFAP